MSSVYIIVNKWQPTGGENESSEIIKVYDSEAKAMEWIESYAELHGAQPHSSGWVVEIPLRGTDFNTYYIEDRDVE